MSAVGKGVSWRWDGDGTGTYEKWDARVPGHFDVCNYPSLSMHRGTGCISFCYVQLPDGTVWLRMVGGFTHFYYSQQYEVAYLFPIFVLSSFVCLFSPPRPGRESTFSFFNSSNVQKWCCPSPPPPMICCYRCIDLHVLELFSISFSCRCLSVSVSGMFRVCWLYFCWLGWVGLYFCGRVGEGGGGESLTTHGAPR